jgi:hypothetical protein
MLSFRNFDSYGNAANTTSSIVGVRVKKEASNLVISNSVFYSFGTTAGTTDVSTIMYSSGNHSISIIRGYHGIWISFPVLRRLKIQ